MTPPPATKLTVGVIGGLGPAATLDFFAKVLAATPATRDQDHLHLILDNNPHAPDRNAALAGTGPSPGPALAASAAALERAGADFLVMVCNTAHAFLPDILRATRLPFVGLIEETVAAALERRPEVRTVGLLAADGCLKTGLYPAAFGTRGVRVLQLEPSLQASFMGLLYRIKAGDTGAKVRREMLGLARRLLAQGAEIIVAGCTEVPLVLSEEALGASLINSTDVLVQATLTYATNTRPLPERE